MQPNHRFHCVEWMGGFLDTAHQNAQGFDLLGRSMQACEPCAFALNEYPQIDQIAEQWIVETETIAVHQRGEYFQRAVLFIVCDYAALSRDDADESLIGKLQYAGVDERTANAELLRQLTLRRQLLTDLIFAGEYLLLHGMDE